MFSGRMIGRGGSHGSKATHGGFFVVLHISSVVLAINNIARRIQASLSLVDRTALVEFRGLYVVVRTNQLHRLVFHNAILDSET